MAEGRMGVSIDTFLQPQARACGYSASRPKYPSGTMNRRTGLEVLGQAGVWQVWAIPGAGAVWGDNIERR